MDAADDAIAASSASLINVNGGSSMDPSDVGLGCVRVRVCVCVYVCCGRVRLLAIVARTAHRASVRRLTVIVA